MCGADCTLTLKPMTHFDRYGVVELVVIITSAALTGKRCYEPGTIQRGGGLHVTYRTVSTDWKRSKSFHSKKIILGVILSNIAACLVAIQDRILY